MLENIDITWIKEGKHEVYEQLFGMLYTPLCSYACSILKDTEEAEDTVQKVFCKLWDQRAEIEIRTSVKSYLYRIVHNECMNRIRQLKIRTRHNLLYAQNRGEINNDLEENYFGSELEAVAGKAIDTLPPRCREVFLKSRIEALSYAEIATQMNISVNTVENQMVKALRLLRESLKDYLFFVWILILTVKQ